MNKPIAKIVSTMGHPLVTVPFVVIWLLFKTEPVKNALLISILVIAGIQIPVLINLYIKFKKGKIESFDVSNRNERKKFYFFLIPLLIGVNLVLYLANQSMELIFGFLFATILLVLMQVMNYFIKSSLHVAVNVYLGFLLFNHDQIAGIIWWLLVIIIAWSRLVLKKHTTKEVVCGFILGAICGTALFIALSKF